MSTKQLYDERDLVTALRRKDDGAFGYLYDHYAGALYSVIKQIVADSEVSSDVLQETFVNIWRKIELYEESKGRLFTWMLNIARNAAIDKTRSKGFQQSSQLRPIMDSDGNYTVFGEVVKGLEVVDKIAATETSKGPDRDRPLQDVRILSVKLVKRRAHPTPPGGRAQIQ